MIEIYNLTDEEREARMNALINKLMNSGLDNKKRNTKWKNRDFVHKVVQEYLHFLLVDRNKKLPELTTQGAITEEEAFSHMEKTYNFRNKPSLGKTKSIMETLDTCFTPQNSNYILKVHGKICDDSIENLTDKLSVITQYNYENAIVKSPQKLRASAVWIRARLAYYSDMIALGREKRRIEDIPASEMLSNTDKFTKNERKMYFRQKKTRNIRTIWKRREIIAYVRIFTDDATLFRAKRKI